MPNRIIRQDILSSERVNQLDAPAEVFYRRLLSVVDDHGLFDARPSILRSSLFPLRVDRVREADCSRWMAACQKAGLIVLYSHDGKPYGQALDTKWVARSDPKFPLPPIANNCAQPQTNAPVVVGVVVDEDDGGSPPAAPPAQPKESVAKRLPADWTLPAEWESWAKAERPEIDARAEALKFADHWRSQGGAKGRKADWQATWRNWIRNAWTKPQQPAAVTHNPGGVSPRLSENEEAARKAEALEAMRRQQRELGYG